VSNALRGVTYFHNWTARGYGSDAKRRTRRSFDDFASPCVEYSDAGELTVDGLLRRMYALSTSEHNATAGSSEPAADKYAWGRIFSGVNIMPYGPPHSDRACPDDEDAGSRGWPPTTAKQAAGNCPSVSCSADQLW
jgi:hypothetical protein